MPDVEMTGTFNMENCPCKRKKCPRHGNCEACKAHHGNSKRPPYCMGEKYTKSDFQVNKNV